MLKCSITAYNKHEAILRENKGRADVCLFVCFLSQAGGGALNISLFDKIYNSFFQVCCVALLDGLS